MGSVCCVPAKQGQYHSSHGRSRGGGGAGSGGGASEPTHWRMNGNYSPPMSSRWEGKSFPDDPNSLQSLYRSSFSSGGSRRGSSRFAAPHQRGGHLIFSPDPSPSSSFRINPVNSSQICPLVDLAPAPAAAEAVSSPCMTAASSSKDGCFSGALSTPESTTPSFYSNAGDFVIQAPPPRHSGSHSFVSKFSRSKASTSSRSPLSDTGVRRSVSGELDLSAGAAGATIPSDWWSMVTFSDLVASSRRERLRWMSAGSGEELAPEVLDAVAAADHVMTLEKIRAYGAQPGSVSPNNDGLVCGLCSRWLSQRSPFSIHRMIGSLDLPGVGVLSCGHVFHADCLEQATCAAEKQDPPCPQCAVFRKMNRGLDAGDVSKGLFKSYSASVRNKLSRVGVLNDEEEAAPEGGGGSLKIFSPREQQIKSGTQVPVVSERGSRGSKKPWGRKPSSFSQVSGDNQVDESASGHGRKGSFSYLRGW